MVMNTWHSISARNLDYFQQIYEEYENYSDFNPLCLYAFLGEKGKWMQVGDTIVFNVSDALYGGKYCSLLGKNDVYEAINQLLQLDWVKKKDKLLLYHVPKSAALQLKDKPGILHVTHDSNNDDYIFSVERIINLNTPVLKSKQKSIFKLLQLHPHLATEVLDHTNDSIIQNIMDVFDAWASETNAQDPKGEREALHRILQLKSKAITVVGVYDSDNLIAFTINEAEKKGYYQGHFGKASRSYAGLGTYIEHETAKIMKEKYGCKYLNIQQDHGIIGLRHYKKSWDPVKYLRKYIVVIDREQYMNQFTSEKL